MKELVEVHASQKLTDKDGLEDCKELMECARGLSAVKHQVLKHYQHFFGARTACCLYRYFRNMWNRIGARFARTIQRSMKCSSSRRQASLKCSGSMQRLDVGWVLVPQMPQFDLM